MIRISVSLKQSFTNQLKKIIMKKILLALMFLFSGIITYAQEDSRDKLRIGIKAGINSSNVYDEHGDSFQADPKFGFVGGGFLTIPVGKYLGVQPEVLFSQKGFKASGRLLNSSYEFSRTTTYIDIPLLIAFKPVEYITIVGGPHYSYLIKQRDVFTNGTSTAAQEQEFKNDNIRKNILGAIFGLDVNVSSLVIGLRYAFDMQNNNGDGTSNTPRYKNKWLQATVGVRF